MGLAPVKIRKRRPKGYKNTNIPRNCFYQPWMCDEIVKMGMKGFGKSQMCAALGIGCRNTFDRWLREFPEFNAAFEEAFEWSQAYMEEVGMRAMVGEVKNFNYQIWVTIMNNRYKRDYSRSPDGPKTTNNTINVFGSLPTSELLEKARLLTTQYQQIEDVEYDVEGSDQE